MGYVGSDAGAGGIARVNGKHKGGEICVNDVTNIL